MTPPLNGRTPMPPTKVLVCFHAHPDDEVFTTGGEDLVVGVGVEAHQNLRGGHRGTAIERWCHGWLIPAWRSVDSSVARCGGSRVTVTSTALPGSSFRSRGRGDSRRQVWASAPRRLWPPGEQ